MAAGPSAAFQHAGVALLRVSTSPGGLDLPRSLGADGRDGTARQVAWLSQMWRCDEVRDAIEVASPALSARAGAVVSGECRDDGQVRRVVLAVAAYLLRWQRRATPFGLFAGTGLARVGGPARVAWGGRRVVARADAAWLGEVVARLLPCPDLAERLAVAASGTAVARGSRLAVPGPVPDGAAQELAPVEVSVRGTPPVRAALDAAGEPVPFGRLAAQLAAGFPAAGEGRVHELLAGLMAQGMLVSSLRAPMTETDALGHVCTRLREARAADIPQIAGLVRELAEIHQELDHGRRSGALPDRAVTARMKMLSQAVESPLVLDSVLDLDVRVPAQVAEEASAAAGVLHRVSPWPSGHPAWADYHRRFTDRYGTGTLVPVLELTAGSGLGFPAGYLGSAREPAARAVTGRDTRLLALIQRAMTDGSGEIVLTEEIIADLDGAAPGELWVPSRAEIAVEVRAASLEALDRGRFTLLVTGTPRPGSSMTGRHASLLPGPGHDLLGATFAACEPGTVPAQLSFAPRKRRNENVARTSQFLPAVIPLGEHRPADPGVIPVADLAVTADEDRFFLVRLSTGELVEPRVTHALEAGTHTPPLARFLAEVTTATCPVYQGFDFGAAGRMPYLPRVRYRRTVLSAGRWQLAAGELPGPAAALAEWEDALGAWRSRWHVPEHVAFVEGDRRQPADLRHPAHRVLLRSRLRRAGRLELREAAAPEELGWIGRAHELAFPLEAAPAGRPKVAVRRVPGACPGDGHAGGPPDVLWARVAGHPGRFDEILTECVPWLLAELSGDAPAWWFRRCRPAGDPEAPQCLDICLPVPGPAGYGAYAAAVAVWAERLRDARLAPGVSLSTERPPCGVFGRRLFLDSGCRVFAADSAAVIAQITLSAQTGLDPRAIAAASVAGIAAGFAGSGREGMGWLIRALPGGHGHLDRALRGQALTLAGPRGLASLPGSGGVAAAWRERAGALAACRQQLAGHGDPLPVLRYLLSEHLARAAGEDTAAGRAAALLARACALRFLSASQEEEVLCP